MKKLDLYIFKTTLTNFLVFFIIISLVLLAGNAFKMYYILFSKGETLGSILSLMFYLNITLTLFTIPMSITLAINATYTELSQNNELTALKGAGLSLPRIYAPAFLFSVIIFLIFLWDISSFMGTAQVHYRLKLINAFRSKIYSGIEANNFYSGIKNISLYVNSVSPDHKTMNGVFAVQGNNVIVARKAKFVDIKNGFLIRFFSSFIYSKNKKSISTGELRTYSITVRNTKLITNKYFSKDPAFMSFFQLVKYYKKTHDREALFLIHRMLIFSLSIFVVSVLSFLLGVTFSRSGKSGGMLLCGGIFFLFYILEIYGESLYKNHGIVWGVWIPDAVLFIASILLFYKKSLE